MRESGGLRHGILEGREGRLYCSWDFRYKEVYRDWISCPCTVLLMVGIGPVGVCVGVYFFCTTPFVLLLDGVFSFFFLEKPSFGSRLRNI